jgi:hypothetical protein
MQKYTCNNCATHFNQDTSSNPTCPVCGSNLVTEIKKSRVKAFIEDKTLLISSAALLLMLIVLFCLPPAIKNQNFDYDVYVNQKDPNDYSVSITIKNEGRIIADTRKFQYSCDSGKTFQDEAVFNFNKNPATPFTMIVKLRNGSASFKYCNNNHDIFIRPSNPKKVDCDCKNLQIIKLYPKKIHGRLYLCIETSLPECPKEYSFSGKEGPYQPENKFLLHDESELTVFARLKKGCDEPVIKKWKKVEKDIPPVKTGINKEELENLLNKYLNASDQEAIVFGNQILNIVGENVKVTYFSLELQNIKTKQSFDIYLGHLRQSKSKIGKVIVQGLPMPSKGIEEISIKEEPVTK